MSGLDEQGLTDNLSLMSLVNGVATIFLQGPPIGLPELTFTFLREEYEHCVVEHFYGFLK